MNKTAIALATAAVVALGATGVVTVYKSISVSEEAKTKIVDYSKVFKLSQRDTATKMIMEYDRTKELFWNKDDLKADNVFVRLVANLNGEYVTVTTYASSTPNTGYYKIDKNYADGLPFTYVQVGCLTTPTTECTSSVLIPVF